MVPDAAGGGIGADWEAGVELGVCAKAVEAAHKANAAKERKLLIRTRTSIPLAELQHPV